MRVEISVEGEIDRWLSFKRTSDEPVLRTPIGLKRLDPVPIDILLGQKMVLVKLGVRFPEGNHCRRKIEDLPMLFQFVPKKPIGLIVLDVGVIVASPSMSVFIAHEEHGDPLRKKKRKKEVADLSCPELHNFWIVSRPFVAAVPAQVLV